MCAPSNPTEPDPVNATLKIVGLIAFVVAGCVLGVILLWMFCGRANAQDGPLMPPMDAPVLRSPKDQPSGKAMAVKAAPVTPKAAFIMLPAIIYPPSGSNALWCLEATSDFSMWLPIVRNMHGAPKGTLTLTVTTGSGHQFFRVRQQKGFE